MFIFLHGRTHFFLILKPKYSYIQYDTSCSNYTCHTWSIFSYKFLSYNLSSTWWKYNKHWFVISSYRNKQVLPYPSCICVYNWSISYLIFMNAYASFSNSWWFLHHLLHTLLNVFLPQLFGFTATFFRFVTKNMMINCFWKWYN